MITETPPAPSSARPRLRGGRLVALGLLGAVTLAALGATAGAWLGWRGAPAMTYGSGPEAAAVVAPGLQPGSLDRISPAGPSPTAGAAGLLTVLVRGNASVTGFEEVQVPTGGRTPAVVDGAAGRLAAAGWAAERERGTVHATRDGQHLTVRATDVPGDGGAVRAVTLLVQPEEPGRVLPLALGGAAAGAVIGALVAVLLGRRGGLVGALPPAVAVVLLPVTLIGLGGLVLRLGGAGIGTVPEREGVVLAAVALGWVQLVGAVVVVAAVVALGLRRSRRRGAGR